jgi:hypothetical protein
MRNDPKPAEHNVSIQTISHDYSPNVNTITKEGIGKTVEAPRKGETGCFYLGTILAQTMCPAVLQRSDAAAEDGCTTAPVSSCSPDGTGGVERARQLNSRECVCNVSGVGGGPDELAVGTCSSPVPC